MKEMKEKNSFHWTLILDPAIEGDKPGYRAFDEGYKRDVFIKWPESIPASERSKPGNAPTDKVCDPIDIGDALSKRHCTGTAPPGKL